jgi:hypothetical protein
MYGKIAKASYRLNSETTSFRYKIYYPPTQIIYNNHIVTFNARVVYISRPIYIYMISFDLYINDVLF